MVTDVPTVHETEDALRDGLWVWDCEDMETECDKDDERLVVGARGRVHEPVADGEQEERDTTLQDALCDAVDAVHEVDGADGEPVEESVGLGSKGDEGLLLCDILTETVDAVHV